MTEPRAALFSVTTHPAVSLDAIRGLKDIVDTAVQNLHDDRRSPHDGGEHVSHQTGPAAGLIRAGRKASGQVVGKSLTQGQKPPGRTVGRRMAESSRKAER
jgi:hypothetical protein